MQTLIRRRVRDAAVGLGLHFLHMSEGSFSHDVGLMAFPATQNIYAKNSSSNASIFYVKRTCCPTVPSIYMLTCTVMYMELHFV